MAQAVRWRPVTAGARFQSQARPCETVVDKVSLRQVFLPVLLFPLSVSFRQCSTHIYLSIADLVNAVK
jgi:hypothetical protein